MLIILKSLFSPLLLAELHVTDTQESRAVAGKTRYAAVKFDRTECACIVSFDRPTFISS